MAPAEPVVAEIRPTAGWLAKAGRIGHYDRVRVTLIHTPATRRTRDSDNLVALLKPCVDGLVDASVVADDDDARVERVMPVIAAPDRSAVPLLLVVEPIEAATVATCPPSTPPSRSLSPPRA